MSRPAPSKTKDPSELTTSFGTVIVEGPRGDPSLKRERPAAISRETLLAVSGGIAVAIICLVQLGHVSKLFDPFQPLTADFAKPLVAAVALALILLIGAAALLPARLLHLPVTLAGAFTGLVLLATFTLGGQAWSFAAAALTFSASWVVGAWVLRLLRVPNLAAIAPVAWLAGAGVVGLFLEFTGRAGWLRWWSVGLIVFGLGAFGLYRLASQGRQLVGVVRAAVTESRLAAGSAAVILLLLGLAAVWTAAPEIQYDALYFKAWLPMEWARTGQIDPLRDHVMLNLHGFSQELAITGHLFGADAVGRYMQWLAVGFIAASLWWFLRLRTRWAPLAAALVAITPPLFWQATTAYDDAILVLAAVSLAMAVITVLDHPQKGALGEGIAIGALAGACIDLKLHLGYLVAGLAIAYLLLRPGRRFTALGGVIAGAVLVAGPLLALRWVDIGNPVFPTLGSIFDSPYWVYIPKTRGVTGPPAGGVHIWDSIIRATWDMITGPHRVVNGLFSLPTLTLLAAIAVGAVMLRRRALSRGAAAVLIAVVIAALGWFVALQVDRYLLPTAFAALLFLGLVAGGVKLTRRGELVGLAALGLIAVALWPATIAQFWNVPGHDMPLAAALGMKDPVDYERQSMPERQAVIAFNADSAPGAEAVSFAYQRTWLTGGRDLLEWWELHNRLQLNGQSLPSTPAEDLRRIRATGADWAIMQNTYPRYPGFYYLFGAIERYGELHWADGNWSLYRLTEHPRPPASLPSCDDALAAAKGCWGDGLDAQPGYTARDPGRSISRTVAVCPGELLTLELGSEGRGLAQVGIDFDGSDPRRGHVHPVIAGNTTARVGATAPPGATRAEVSLVRPPAGLNLTSVRLGHVGGCDRNAS
jgi:hypothetical protein